MKIFLFLYFGFYFSYQFLDLLKSVCLCFCWPYFTKLDVFKKMLPSNFAQKFMNCVTFYKYPNRILNDKTYSISIIGRASVLVYSIFFNCKIYFSLFEQQRLLMKLIFISFLLRVNFALTNNLFCVQLFIFVAQNVIDCM